MVEKYLLDIGMRCGSVKNFNASILEDMRLSKSQHWYFATPFKVTDKGGGLKECTVNMAYPFLAVNGEISEQEAIKRISPLIPEYEAALLKALRKGCSRLIVIPSQFYPVALWANEKGAERVDRKDFGAVRIHIISASLTIRYRDSWFTCNC
jgi:hypothetical protein